MESIKENPKMKMNLQFFAEGEEPTPTDPTPDKLDTEDEDEIHSGKVDTDKVVEKLQKRIGKEQAEKNETKSQLEQALARIEELENGSKKSIKEKSDEDKAAELQKAKDDEISQLKAQIRVSEITKQADEVLKESGISLKAAELSLLVDVDENKTYENVKTFLNLLESQRTAWEKERNTGTTPERVPTIDTELISREKFDAMTYSQKADLAKRNPKKFSELTGGI